ncbi:MAG: phosphoethanolamine transferase CptA [Zoogloeaceae bacterium]|nr:phosphoethanolamine transferase CptA [Zoogloeaceae bacterium]
MPTDPKAQSAPTSESKTDWRGLLLIFGFFWYFSGIHHLLLQAIDAVSFAAFRLATVASALWLIPVLLAPKYTRQISAVIGLVLWAFSLISLGYFFIYHNEFSQSVLFIIFESNPAEAQEYAANYFVWWMVPAFIVYTLVAWQIWRKLKPVSVVPRQAGMLITLLVLGLFVYPQYKNLRGGVISSAAAAETIVKRMEPAVPWQILVGYSEYRQQLAAVEALVEKNQDIPPIQNLIDRNGNTPTTLVLVIGESTNRQHMSLYGYHRQTTPRLDALRPQLTVFDNVVASRPYTIETLQQALTFADQENPELYLTTPSLMNIMKQAGYRTYWITNQQTMTQRNTMLTNFSKQTDEQVYLNNTRVQNSRAYDGAVLDPFSKILSDGVVKRFIIVHLLGTHMRYEFRYPPEEDFFKGRNDLPDWADDEKAQFINEYDNAVRYNDYVLGSLIERLRKAQLNSQLLYFSDHGEDVFDTPPHKFVGRNEAKPTPAMYTVPFLLWQSEAWRKSHAVQFSGLTSRPYQTAHLIHTWADLVGLSFDGLDPTKSVINDKFQERPLLVGDPSSPKTLIDLRPQLQPHQQPANRSRKTGPSAS